MMQVKSNKEIYNILQNLNDAFVNENRYLPAKIYFYIQKNKNILQQALQAIAETRQSIIEQYGVLDEESGNYNFSDEALKEANAELDDLLKITQEINIGMIKLSDIENCEFTPKQIEALFFMIEED